MGGEGSGRKPDMIKMAERQHEQFIKTTGGGEQIEIPNLSGVQKPALKSGSPLTAGSVLFADAAGQIAQDNTNLFWDDTLNEFGIGTADPTQKLDVGTGNIALGYNQTATNMLYKTFVTSHAVGNVPSQLSMILDDGSQSGIRIKNTRAGSFNAQAIHFDVHEGGVAARADAVVINYTGNVGIGTAIPVTLCHLSGGSLTISNTTAPATPTAAGACFVSGGALFYIGSSGTVTQVAAA